MDVFGAVDVRLQTFIWYLYSVSIIFLNSIVVFMQAHLLMISISFWESLCAMINRIFYESEFNYLSYKEYTLEFWKLEIMS